MGMIPQNTIISNADGSLLVDHNGRFENLHDDNEAICHKIGVPVRKLPHKKYIKKKPYQYYYTPKLRDMVASFSKEDIDTFGYSFDDSMSLLSYFFSFCRPGCLRAAFCSGSGSH